MPIQMLCDICDQVTERNYVAQPLVVETERVELIVGVNIDGKPSGIICFACVALYIRTPYSSQSYEKD